MIFNAHISERKNIISLLTIITFSIINCQLSIAQYDSIPHDGFDRTYLLHLPTRYTGTDTIPLVIAMHGGFGNAANIENQSQLSVKADSENFIVVYPEGLEGGFLNISSWNAGWCCGNSSKTNVDDIGFINALLDTLIGKYSIDINRIYATGMSNGGFMTFRLACELSERIAAAAPVAASMSLTDCTPTRPVPIINIHSYPDEHVPYLGGIGNGPSSHHNSPQDSVMERWSNYNTCSKINDTILNNAEYTFVKWTSCNCGSEIHFYNTHDGGHSWPGGVKTQTGDPTSAYINATDLMWSFFLQHSLDCSTPTNSNKVLIKENVLKIFPNPSTGVFNIKFYHPENNYTITVYNQLGSIILKSDNQTKINLSKSSEGLYFISVQIEDSVITRKLFLTKN